jgi:flagellar biosynthesis protein FliP
MIPSMQKIFRMKLKLIKSEKDYEKALKRLDKRIKYFMRKLVPKNKKNWRF